MTLRAVLVAVALAAVTALAAPPVAGGEPSIPLCQFGGQVPCYCPDGGGQMRMNQWQTCGSVRYGPWGNADAGQP